VLVSRRAGVATPAIGRRRFSVAETRRVTATTRKTRRLHASPHETSGDNYLDTHRDHVLEQRAQQLLAIAVGRRRRRPDLGEILTEREDRLALRLGSAGAAASTPRCASSCAAASSSRSRWFPLRFEAARDQTIVRIDRPIASFRRAAPRSARARRPPELRQGGVVICLELCGGLQRGRQAGRGERREERRGDGRVDLAAADAQAVLTATVDDVGAGAVIAGRAVAAAVVHRQAAAAMATDRQPLQQSRPPSRATATA